MTEVLIEPLALFGDVVTFNEVKEIFKGAVDSKDKQSAMTYKIGWSSDYNTLFGDLLNTEHQYDSKEKKNLSIRIAQITGRITKIQSRLELHPSLEEQTIKVPCRVVPEKYSLEDKYRYDALLPIIQDLFNKQENNYVLFTNDPTEARTFYDSTNPKNVNSPDLITSKDELDVWIDSAKNFSSISELISHFEEKFPNRIGFTEQAKKVAKDSTFTATQLQPIFVDLVEKLHPLFSSNSNQDKYDAFHKISIYEIKRERSQSHKDSKVMAQFKDKYEEGEKEYEIDCERHITMKPKSDGLKESIHLGYCKDLKKVIVCYIGPHLKTAGTTRGNNSH